MAGRMPRGIKRSDLPSKICIVCNRPFTWRKKWERCWDEVTTCSKACNAERRRRKQLKSIDKVGEDEQEIDDSSEPAVRAKRKARKKQLKLERRARREGKADPAVGRKQCDLCARSVDLLIRCRVDSTRKWKMTCGRCWFKASGGVPDGDADHPYYCYGGLWRNRHVNCADNDSDRLDLPFENDAPLLSPTSSASSNDEGDGD